MGEIRINALVSLKLFGYEWDTVNKSLLFVPALSSFVAITDCMTVLGPCNNSRSLLVRFQKRELT